MRYPDADEIKRLTQKLKDKGDITLEEADEIYFLDPPYPYDLRPLYRWYEAVAEKIKQGFRGNFVFTVDIFKDAAVLWPAQSAIRENGTFEDLCNLIIIDKQLNLSFKDMLSQTFKDAFAQNKGYYEITGSRAGTLYYPIKTATGTYTIAQFVKKLSLAIITGISFRIERELFKVHKLLKTMFSMTSGSLPTPEAWSNEDIKLFILGSFIKFHNFPCIATCDYDCSIIFVEEKYAPIINAATKISFKELVENAIYNNVIDKTMVWILTTSRALENPLVKKFTEASIEYINEKIRMGMAQNFMKDMVENTSEWMDITR
jgi:hypothetical protein